MEDSASSPSSRARRASVSVTNFRFHAKRVAQDPQLAASGETGARKDTKLKAPREDIPAPSAGTQFFNVAEEVRARNDHPSGRGSNYDLWIAAKKGLEQRLKKALEEGADFTYEVEPDDLDEDTVLLYKNRKVTSQAIHAAALYSGSKAAHACVMALIDARADVKTKATITEKQSGKVVTTRELEAIHMAAGVGNAKIVEYLINNRADPNAQALVNGETHYYPIHDAVWFNRKESVKTLLRLNADPLKKNYDGNTALHLAAGMGHDEMVKFLLYDRHEPEETMEEDEGKEDHNAPKQSAEDKIEDWRHAMAMAESRNMVKRENNSNEDPLTVAVERGHFPADQLYLFTRCFDSLGDEKQTEGRVQAFKKVALTCPDAAPKLVRTYNRNRSERRPDMHEPVRFVDVKNTEISKEWKKSIIAGAEKEKITVKDLCELIAHAPLAAVDLLDMLTTEPKEENKQHNPLPVRANIPYDQEACRLSCVYVQDKDWTWNSSGRGKLTWQEKLAPQDSKQSQEVKVKVLMLPGVINSGVVHSLAATKDHKIFTKLVIHALLKHLWISFRPMFLVDLGHQFLSTVVLSYWILIAGQVETPQTIRCGLWGVLAAEGISECFMFIWTCIICRSKLGKKLFVRYIKREYYRFVMGGFALALAIETSPQFQPAANSSILLSINSLVHWITMLFEIRAFRATGRRILPIMKSVLPIVGMLVIMLFISLAFMHAFWAMDRSGIDEISMFNIVVLLFTGEQFLSPEDLLEMPQSKRTAMVLLSIGGVFIFLTCTINVFIAVLSDCYDHEQDRMVCTFLKERARICSSYFFRPKLKASGFGFIHKGIMKLSWWRWWFLIVLIPAIYVLVLYGITQWSFLTLWISAIFPAAAVLFVQCILRDVASVGWKSNYLWFCHEVDVEEEMFLAPEQRDEEDSKGRVTRMKQYIKSTMKSCDQNIQALSMKVDDLQKSTTSDLDDLRRLLGEMSQASKTQSTDVSPTRGDALGADGTPFSDIPEEGTDSDATVDELKAAEAAGPAPHEGCRTPTEREVLEKNLSRSPLDRPPEPPTNTFEASIPSGQPGPPQEGIPLVAGTPRPSVGHAMGPAGGDWEELQKEVSSMKGTLKELQASVVEQRHEQEKLQATCQDIQSLLKRVVDLAETRHTRKSKSTRGGPTSSTEGLGFLGEGRVPDEVLSMPAVAPRPGPGLGSLAAFGRGNEAPEAPMERLPT